MIIGGDEDEAGEVPAKLYMTGCTAVIVGQLPRNVRKVSLIRSHSKSRPDTVKVDAEP